MKNRKNLLTSMYFVAYLFINAFWYMNRVTFMSNWIELFKIISVIIFIIILLLQDDKYNRIDFLKMVVLLALCLTIYFVSKSDIPFIMLLMFMTVKNIDIRELVKIDLITKILIVASLMILFSLKMTNEFAVYRDGIQRFSFGFYHPNIFGFVLANIWIDFTFLHKKKINFFLILCIACSLIFIDYYSDSRSSAILMLFVFVICFINKSILEKILNLKIVKFFITYSWIIFTILSLSICFIYRNNSKTGIMLNDILTGRPKQCVNYLDKYNVNLFGNNLEFVSTEESILTGKNTAILDNAYIHFLLRFGIIFDIFLMIQFSRFFKNAYKEKEYLTISILFSFLVYCLVENRINRFVFIFMLGKYFYKNIKKSGEEEV